MKIIHKCGYGKRDEFIMIRLNSHQKYEMMSDITAFIIIESIQLHNLTHK